MGINKIYSKLTKSCLIRIPDFLFFFFMQLRSSLSSSEIGFGISELRYSWLILNKHLSPIEQVLLTCDATMDNFEQEQKLSELTLVLTDRFLYLIKDPNLMLPNVLRLPITHIVTPSQRHHDPSLITITIRMSAQVTKILSIFIHN